MRDRQQFTPVPAIDMPSCRVWSAHLDALDRHLSSDTWALVAVTVVLIAYPVARIVIPATLHHVVPELVRTMLHLI